MDFCNKHSFYKHIDVTTPFFGRPPFRIHPSGGLRHLPVPGQSPTFLDGIEHTRLSFLILRPFLLLSSCGLCRCQRKSLTFMQSQDFLRPSPGWWLSGLQHRNCVKKDHNFIPYARAMLTSLRENCLLPTLLLSSRHFPVCSTLSVSFWGKGMVFISGPRLPDFT